MQSRRLMIGTIDWTRVYLTRTHGIGSHDCAGGFVSQEPHRGDIPMNQPIEVPHRLWA